MLSIYQILTDKVYLMCCLHVVSQFFYNFNTTVLELLYLTCMYIVHTSTLTSNIKTEMYKTG